ncbi:hypothetical protein EVAR_20648_1 [Eumeta japonica]|uniref:Uncharacterized protein n=1 Tax=Eumeta variegata TaxID=151549 RepID=A0A4C1VAW5_EUMVA|nr:hypothetical protein EVAR_20648_1 [Eumeta japonica]
MMFTQSTEVFTVKTESISTSDVGDLITTLPSLTPHTLLYLRLGGLRSSALLFFFKWGNVIDFHGLGMADRVSSHSYRLKPHGNPTLEHPLTQRCRLLYQGALRPVRIGDRCRQRKDDVRNLLLKVPYEGRGEIFLGRQRFNNHSDNAGNMIAFSNTQRSDNSSNAPGDKKTCSMATRRTLWQAAFDLPALICGKPAPDLAEVCADAGIQDPQSCKAEYRKVVILSQNLVLRTLARSPRMKADSSQRVITQREGYLLVHNPAWFGLTTLQDEFVQ